MLMLITLGLIIGIIFGVALEKSRIFEAGTIIRQLELKTYIPFKVFLTAIATMMTTVTLLNIFFGVEFDLKPINLEANILGGAIFGLGLVLSGAYPATIFVQIGAGYRDAFSCFAGGLLGATIFGFIKEPFIDPVYFVEEGIRLQLHEFFEMEYWMVVIIALFVILFILFVLEKRQRWQDELGRNYDGVS